MQSPGERVVLACQDLRCLDHVSHVSGLGYSRGRVASFQRRETAAVGRFKGPRQESRGLPRAVKLGACSTPIAGIPVRLFLGDLISRIRWQFLYDFSTSHQYPEVQFVVSSFSFEARCWDSNCPKRQNDLQPTAGGLNYPAELTSARCHRN